MEHGLTCQLSTVQVWDLRTYQELHCYTRNHGYAVGSLDLSMTNMLAVSSGGGLEVYKDVFSGKSKAYIREQFKGRMVESVRFRPFEEF